MPSRREFAPHERVYFRDRVRRLTGPQRREEELCFATVSSVMVGAVIATALVAVGTALTP